MLKNYYARRFSGGFLFGAAVPTILLLGSIGWHMFQTYLLLRQTSTYGQPVVIVTNPFIDFTNPATGAPIISGAIAFVAATLLCGVCVGLFSLGFGALNRRVRNTPCDY